MDKKYIWQEIQENGFIKTRFCKEIDFPSLIEEISGKDSLGQAKVNLKLRFPQLLDITDKTKEGEDRDSIVMHEWELDLYLHFMAALDMYSGYNINNQTLDSVYNDFLNEKYGERVKTLFLDLSLKEQDIILRKFCNSEHEGIEMFYRTYKEIYPSGLIYKNDDIIIVYLDREESDETNHCLELLEILFLPLEYLLKIHFKYHMGIIGISDTMKIGKIRIV